MNVSEIKQVLLGHGLRPNKLMGQHFLIDENVLAKIIRSSSIRADETILEIGPGLGALTFELAKRAGRVIAVEKDERLCQRLKEEIQKRGAGNIELIRGDILKLSEDLFARISPYKVVANIPYYLTARLLRKLLAEVSSPVEIILTVQKEVAERIAAKPPRMNLLALAAQAYGAPKVLFSISRNAFAPAPNVESAALAVKNISRRNFSNESEEKMFFKIARAAFQKKRKTLANSLRDIHGPKNIREALAKLGKSESARPEELSLKDWITFTRLIK